MAISNPFAELSTSVPPTFMKTYAVIMALLVVVGTLFDIVHKKSARYFFENWRNSTKNAKQKVGGAEMVSLAAQAAVIDVMASGEFCNQRRRLAHLLTLWGFRILAGTTATLVFAYSTPGAAT